MTEVATKGPKETGMRAGGGRHVAEAGSVTWSGGTSMFATHEPIGFGGDRGEDLKEVLA
jgi:hypothetical protein